MQTLIFYCANKVGFTLDFTKTSGDPTELPSPSLGTSLQEQLIAPNRTDTAMILGAALVVPMIFVHIAGYIKVGHVPPKSWFSVVWL